MPIENSDKKCFNRQAGGRQPVWRSASLPPRGSCVTVPFKKQALLMVLAFLALAVLTGHQTVPPMDRDESRFAQASRQMVESGDLVTIRFQDELRAKKPAGIYWL